MSKRQVIAMAAKLGAHATIDDNYEELDVEIEAPSGYHWAYSGVHALVAHQNDSDTRAMVWCDLIERMKYGIEQCDKRCEFWSQ